MTILELIEREAHIIFRRAGKEHHGACPWCGDGGKGGKSDRFVIWPQEGRYWCRQCERKGDAIQFVREYRHLDFRQAKEYLGEFHQTTDGHKETKAMKYTEEPLRPPCQAWQEPAIEFVFDCQAHLMERLTNARALDWLHGRKLADTTLWQYGLGYNPADAYLDRQAWGLPPEMGDKGRPKRLWLPRGIVIPWMVDGELWGIRIRRPVGEPKYYWLPGGTPALYNVDTITVGGPVVLCEGELDALTIAQEAKIAAVATGSTHGARRTRWIARLALASVVLVAYDNDDPGNQAAGYWLDALPNARRWRPYWDDANQLAQDVVNIGSWVTAGLA